MDIPRQCAILVGGLGTRLGSLTADTPKPLLGCGGRPFLAWILRELCRFGIERVLLLAGYMPERVEAFAREAQALLPKSLDISVSVEPRPAGTGGALLHARDLLDETFLLLNGDSWLDTDLACFLAKAELSGDCLGHIALRHVSDASRYGGVELQGGRITAFREKPASPLPGLINGGIYIMSKRVLDGRREICSLETDILPALAQTGLLTGQELDGYFIDIGVPDDYHRAGYELPQRLHRPAVFFDRDGVLNEDYGWVGTLDRFRWIDGAKEAVRLVNQVGFHAFVVTNQSGVARGLYTEADVAVLHRRMEADLLIVGASLDDIRYCPHHPEAVLPQYRKVCSDRKPAPGMLNDLAQKWNIDKVCSIMIGNSETDLQAAAAAGIRGHCFNGGNLKAFVEALLPPGGSMRNRA